MTQYPTDLTEKQWQVYKKRFRTARKETETSAQRDNISTHVETIERLQDKIQTMQSDHHRELMKLEAKHQSELNRKEAVHTEETTRLKTSDIFRKAVNNIIRLARNYYKPCFDAEHVSDVLVKVGQEYAISAEELMAAFQRGGAALHASGTDFEKSAALFAATNASLQNAETTGTMWKTVSARIRGATTELEEMGEETDGLAQGLSKYREEIKALSGVDIMKDENTYKDMYDIFVQLAEVWDNMEDVSQSRVAEILGGTRNTSGIMSTITNIKDAIGAYSSAMDSAGTATEANNIYMDTTKAKVGELKAAFQELSSDFISSNFTKGAVEGLKGIVEVIDKIVETVGSLGTILAGFGLAKVIKNVA